MGRNYLVAIIVVLACGVGALGYAYYDAHRQPTGIDISVGNQGLTVKTK